MNKQFKSISELMDHVEKEARWRVEEMKKNKPKGGELKYVWNCTECSKVIRANSENTLTINKNLHIMKHKDD